MQNIIDPDTLDLWRKAGKIAATALRYGERFIKPGASILEVSDKIEAKIISMGGDMAFPVQINLGKIAAHYCAQPDDELTFKDEVICMDVGVHVDGAVGDNALSVDLSGEHADLIKASREAVDNAIKMLAPGVKVSEVGAMIEETIMSYGFQPIRNLSGHGMNRWKIHTTPGMPNYNNNSNVELKENMIIAIEPFATNGSEGLIHEANECQVFMQVKQKNPRSLYAREALKMIKGYNGLPFTTRWLTKTLQQTKVNFGLKELVKEGIITAYPPLIENSKGLVSQAENTMFITANGCEVLTIPDEDKI